MAVFRRVRQMFLRMSDMRPLFVLRRSSLCESQGCARACRYVRFETLLAFFLMLPSTLLIPRPFIDFIAALEPCAAMGGFFGYGGRGLCGQEATRGCLEVTVRDNES
jgi:hypothetical protein